MAVISLDSRAKPQVFLLCLFFPYHPPLLFCPEIRTHLGKTSHLCSSMLPMAVVPSAREKSYPGPAVCPGRQELLRRDAQGPVWAGRKQGGRAMEKGETEGGMSGTVWEMRMQTGELPVRRG